MGYSESAVRIRVRIRIRFRVRFRLGLGLGLDSVRGSTISHKMKYLPGSELTPLELYKIIGLYKSSVVSSGTGLVK